MNTNNSDQPTHSTSYREYNTEDEISLVDLVLILIRHWKTGLVCFFLVLAAAVVYMLMEQPVYKSSAVLSVGTMGQLQSNFSTSKVYLEDPDLLVREIKQFDSSVYKSASISDVANEDERFITIKSTTTDPEAAKLLLEQVINSILEKHNRIHTDIAAEFETTIKRLKNQIEDAESNSSSGFSMADLQSAILSLRIASSEPVLSKTQIIESPSLPSSPSQPNYKLITALAVVLGLFAAIMAIFLAEFVVNVRHELQQRKGDF